MLDEPGRLTCIDYGGAMIYKQCNQNKQCSCENCSDFLPPYFRKPDIPPKADLMIFVELLQVDPPPDYSAMEVPERIKEA